MAIKTAMLAVLPLLACGTEAAKKDECSWSIRWSVKTLTDKDASKVDLHPIKTTVGELTRIKRAMPIPDPPRMEEELKVYEVVCRIGSYSVAEDGDLNLMLSDPTHPDDKMIAELPDPDCGSVKDSRHAEDFRRAWAQFRADCAEDGRVIADGKDRPVRNGLYRITGVAFFDLPHFILKGASRNEIELHPVLSIERVEE
jgi:hypothetical protein